MYLLFASMLDLHPISLRERRISMTIAERNVHKHVIGC